MNCPVVRLVFNEGLSGVYEAMVIAPVAKLNQRGVDTRLVTFVPLGQAIRTQLRQHWRSRIESVRRVYDRPIHLLFSPPARMRWLWRESWVLQRWLMLQIAKGGSAIVHCRGPEATAMALRVRVAMPKLKIIFDMRGLVDEEYLCQNLAPDEAEYERLRRMQMLAIKGADAIFCVSYAMSDYVISQLGAAAENVAVLPCATGLDTSQIDRAAARSRLGMNDRFVVAMCGGAQRWQSLEQSARAFRLIKDLCPTAHLLVLTPDALQMRRELEAMDLAPSDMTILSAAHSQIPHYLAAADLGLLLRDRSLLNAVASPVKFAEFLACGVPVAISEGLGDFSQLVRRRDAGVVLPIDAADSVLKQILLKFLESYDHQDFASRCREVAQTELSFDSNIERTLQVYQRMCGHSCESCM